MRCRAPERGCQPAARLAIPSVLALASAILPGCTVVEMHRAEAADRQRISDKQDQLVAEERHQQELLRQKQELTEALRVSQLSADDLAMQLQRLASANESLGPRQRPDVTALTTHFGNRLATIQHQDGLTDDQRRQRIEALKKELLLQLQMQH
jgi:hypothetical protein